MRTREYDKLTVGQRVIVTGKQDGEVFKDAAGMVVQIDGSYPVTIRFDKFLYGRWGFERSNVRNFNIRPEPKVAPKPEPVKPVVAKKRPHGKQEYKGNGKHEWETVTGVTGDTVRLRVPGGWVYRVNYSGELSTTFVPVPQAVGYAV